jgi:thiosulfate dehydrogenase
MRAGGNDSPPLVDSLPSLLTAHKNSNSVALGKSIFHDTVQNAKAYVGNRLSCNDCHINDGTTPQAAPLIGLPALFPMFSPRANRKISLEDRIEECFVRSENGRPLPYSGKEMNALIDYIDSISEGQAKGKEFSGRGLVKLAILKGDPKRGELIYQGQCSVCHGSDGNGVAPSLPPLWGADAFNDGAGMHRIEKMAAFVLKNMPQTKPGSLSPQEAFDVSAYIHTKPRPKYNPIYDKY